MDGVLRLLQQLLEFVQRLRQRVLRRHGGADNLDPRDDADSGHKASGSGHLVAGPAADDGRFIDEHAGKQWADDHLCPG